MGALIPAAAGDFKIHFQGGDISSWVEPECLSVRYTDVLEAESDTLEVELMDPLSNWCGPWWPGQGDTLALWIGRRGGELRDIGGFTLDEIEHSGPPDVISLRGVAAPMDTDLRSNRHAAYEGTTLPAIAAEIAAKHGMTVAGDLAAVPVGRITQADETDLAFLHRLARDFGYVFSVKAGQLVFQDITALHALPPVRALAREDLFSWRLSARQADTPTAIQASYWDPDAKDWVSGGGSVEGNRKDTLVLRGRAENAFQAARRVQAAAARASLGSITGSLELDGDPALRAGANVILSGMGRLDGRYRIDRATHQVDRAGGYTTSLEVSKLPGPKEGVF
ncbi:MAG: hypothetical protein GX580_02925 [Candidatus Hydrogenedens sp.]|nr:hypothetical protein [Candidatus Hydrogenedentota bacterium]NLF56572.1 hypothetical protein [Candidatus Hydrogenedens sp.]